MGSYWATSKSEVEFYLVHARRPLPKNKFSRFRGVHKNSNPDKPFRVAICFNGRRILAGTYSDEIEAAKAYNRLALHVIGPKAFLNEISEERNGPENA
jgi:hypothetical protein